MIHVAPTTSFRAAFQIGAVIDDIVDGCCILDCLFYNRRLEKLRKIVA